MSILTEPKNALTKQYRKLFDMEGVELEFREDALRAVAHEAMQRKTGARGLRTILENVLLDTMYELPSLRNVRRSSSTRASSRRASRSPTWSTARRCAARSSRRSPRRRAADRHEQSLQPHCEAGRHVGSLRLSQASVLHILQSATAVSNFMPSTLRAGHAP